MPDDFSTTRPGTTAAATRPSMLEYLPEIYADDPFLGQYLAAFERVLLRNDGEAGERGIEQKIETAADYFDPLLTPPDRKSTRLNSSHANISYAVFCLKKKKKI